MYRSPITTRWLGAAMVLSLSSLAVLACGDDDDVAGDVAPEATTTTVAEEAELADPPAEPLSITARDYEFDGLPATAEAGTSLSLTNASTEEVHEIVLLKLNDDETRSLDELLALPEAERDAAAQFRGVTVAFPGEDAAFADGSLTLDEPGRYVVICTIPAGADPQAYRDAVADPDAQGPPEVDGGPPHLVLGMVGEIEVGS